ncbi:MAG: hypothetical protein KME26_23440 [Oscillatoria princeps RMCB-10]|jgi:hypothetical protein|nr:hypothetical protein [Oscillatoria princeps RMCB-10]
MSLRVAGCRALAQLQTVGLWPNYKRWGFSPTTNGGALAQLQTDSQQPASEPQQV